jgi:uncharacterized damage-inducible protein DinB
MRPLAIEQNLEILRQGLELLRTLDDEAYSRPGPAGESGLGPHFRHSIEFYRTFLAGLAERRIDYDARARDEDVETDRRSAIRAIEEILSDLEAASDIDRNETLRVRVDAPRGADPNEVCSQSTLLRELQFILSHTVHHYALIARDLRARGIDPGRDFGVATATLVHLQDQNAP